MASHMSSLVHAKHSQQSPAIHHSIQLTAPPASSEARSPDPVDYSSRGQWLRAAVLGATDGLVSVASLMVRVGAVSQTPKAMLVSGLAGLVAGAYSMAIGEHVSIYAQYDIEVAQMRMDEEAKEPAVEKASAGKLPSPRQAAAAAALAFGAGALLPLVASGFVRPSGVRIGVMCAVASAVLAGFGAAGAPLGGASARTSVMEEEKGIKKDDDSSASDGYHYYNNDKCYDDSSTFDLLQ